MEEQKQSHLFNDLEFDQTAKQHILSIASWAMTVVIVAVIGYVITLVGEFSTSAEPVTRPEGFGGFGLALTGGNTGITVFIILIGLLINFFLYRFASQAKNGINGLSQEQLTRSFNSLKTYFMILSVVGIILFLIVLLAVVVSAIGSQ